MKRSYTLKQRAEQMAGTHQRITEAAVALHGSVGPARTTISAIAERAGVERATVYRHFADEAAIFAACSAHWISAHPPPDPSAWDDPDGPTRLHQALRTLYAYYAGTRRMWQLTYRDVAHVAALEAPFGGWLAYLDQARDRLAEAWTVRGVARQRLRAALRHAIDFRTWDHLTGEHLDDQVIARLMDAMVCAAVSPSAHVARGRSARASGRRV
jgi:AcrR family transcriptional regulator